ncbi:ABC transporter permease [Vibrio sp. MA40-2]|uniref:ABC transporter permease n=1 Tax=Vibrio sp. MA40-2 TaxID=3391828 RepID=UPI0039A66254
MLSLIKNLLKYREFIVSNVKREFQLKYQASILGATWSVINPLSMIFVYTVIFSQLMKARIPGVEGVFAYSIYLCSGIIIWGLFSEILTRCVDCFIDNASLIKKVNFPKICIPATIVLGAFINFLIIFIIFLFFLLISNNLPSFELFFVFPILMVLTIFAVGLGIFLGVLNVFFRDIGQFTKVLIQFWFWGTPIIYPMNILPENIGLLLSFNPMTIIVSSMQAVFIDDLILNWSALTIVFVVSIALMLFSLMFFRKHVNEIADEI